MPFIKKHPLISGALILVIAIILITLLFGSKGVEEQTMIVQRASYVNKVAVSGKVVAAQGSDLGFDQSGRVSSVTVHVGDKVKAGTIIASIDNGAIRADIVQKQATLEKERAKLAALERGTRTEELAEAEQTYTDASSALLIALRNAHVEIEGALITKIDSLFINGNTSNPEITIRTQSFNEKRSIENERLVVGEKVGHWKTALSTLSPTPDAAAIASARTISTDTIRAVKSFVDRLATIAGAMTPANSGVQQADIDTDLQAVNAAAVQVGDAATAEQTAYAAWTSATRTLTLKQAGSASEDITAQAAQVRSAEADVASADAQLRKALIIAPYDGTITKMDLKVGEIVSPSASEVSIMGTNTFEVDSYIPEVYIAQISTDNKATLTLDAFGNDVVFNAAVTSIDPGETIRDGVSTYKTKLQLVDGDPRIRSGMTANIQIITETEEGAIAVPQGVIITKDGAKYVQVRSGTEVHEVPVTVGGTAGFGQVEILSGLNEGDVVILPPVTTN